MQESAESLSVPLVFLRPIGIAAADAMRLMEAAKRLDGLVRWRLAPAGVAADVYMAHASRVRYPDGMEMPSAPPDTAAGALMPHEDPATDSAPMPLASLADSVRSFGASLSSLGMSRGPYNSTGSGMSGSKPMQLDQHGWYKDHPVCVLGSHTDPLITDQLGDMQALRFPAALHQMISQLRRIESEIIGIRMLYQLGRMSWEHRQSWREHRLHLHHGSRLIAVIDGSRWQAHILESCHVDELEAAQVMRAPMSGTAFEAEGFHSLSMEFALWELAKRCPERQLAKVLPSHYLNQLLSPRRVPELSNKQMGDHCTALVRALDVRPMTAAQLKASLRLSDTAMIRALGSLAIIGAIRSEPDRQGFRRWLPAWLRKLPGFKRPAVKSPDNQPEAMT